MSESNHSFRVAIVLFGAFLLEAFLLLWPGVLAINGHEVDAIHAAGAALRIANGAAQHLDFVTPLGVLTFQPVVFFLDAGFGIGRSFILAQLLVAALISPVVWYVAVTRLSKHSALFFAGLMIVMITALVYGGDNPTVSISMYYNRWAWAVYFLAVCLILVPRKGGGPVVDGVVLGLCLSVLALLKVTYFVTLAPVVLVWILTQRNFGLIAATSVVGVSAVVLATLSFGGIAFWEAYVSDLLMVSGSDVRPAPGKSLGDVIASPALFGATICLLAAIIGLRKSGHGPQGVLLLLLAPGFVFITYQNWGNDPKWLILLGFLSLRWRLNAIGDIFGVPARNYFSGLALVAFSLSVPSILNMSLSTLRHFGADPSAYVAIALDPVHADLMIERDRSFKGEAMVDLAVAGSKETEPLMFAGTNVGGCTQKFGYFGKMQEIAKSLRKMGYGDKKIALVDVNNPLPVIGGFETVNGDPPWYYGGTTAAAAADVLVVPKCPVSKVTFAAYIAELNKSELSWVMVEETPHFRLFTPAQ